MSQQQDILNAWRKLYDKLMSLDHSKFYCYYADPLDEVEDKERIYYVWKGCGCKISNSLISIPKLSSNSHGYLTAKEVRKLYQKIHSAKTKHEMDVRVAKLIEGIEEIIGEDHESIRNS